MNRWLNQFRLQFEKRVIDVYGRVTFATGVPTLVQPNCKGLLSVTRNSAGLFTFVFGTNTSIPKDTYVKFLGCDVVFQNASAHPAVYSHSIRANNISTPNVCSIQVAFYDIAGALVDPADADTLYIDFCLGDSTAP